MIFPTRLFSGPLRVPREIVLGLTRCFYIAPFPDVDLPKIKNVPLDSCLLSVQRLSGQFFGRKKNGNAMLARLKFETLKHMHS